MVANTYDDSLWCDREPGRDLERNRLGSFGTLDSSSNDGRVGIRPNQCSPTSGWSIAGNKTLANELPGGRHRLATRHPVISVSAPCCNSLLGCSGNVKVRVMPISIHKELRHRGEPL